MKEFIEKLIGRLEQLAEDYNNGWVEQLLEAKKNCGEDSDCSECPFGQIEDRCILAELQIKGGNNGWIPCSERLPEVSGEYYTYVYYDGHYMYSVDEIDCDGMVKKWNCVSDYKVVAWKPIAPYQPKGE